ncbi:branched-chain amino acid transport [Deinococcus radiopugnans]|uniref:Branched-chain amino acid transport n=1 Tax=Deinococcus radiopugnans TaxID=57497 RepID=A0A0A7KKM2_9DEIO|nr:AzlD domain-containing protein [Deinococcus radiopugnans]AIZ45108.1 branched-chain amino acid transport [Deinococcus radiopugnans]
MTVTAVIVLMWAVTYPARWLGLNLGRVRLPPFWLAFLQFVPVSVIAALIVPEVLGSPEWPRRLLASVVGGVIVWRSGHLALGILGGFAAYWAARSLAG